MKKIFCEVSMESNPGPGVLAYVAYNGNARLFGSFKEFSMETSNRAKIQSFLGAVRAIELLKEDVEGFEYITNHKTLVDAVNLGWIEKWQQQGWRGSSRKKIENQDLWEQVHECMSKYNIKLTWSPKETRRFRLPRKAAKSVRKQGV